MILDSLTVRFRLRADNARKISIVKEVFGSVVLFDPETFSYHGTVNQSIRAT